MENKNGNYEKLFINNFKNNKEILINKENILQYMKFNLEFINNDKSNLYIEKYENIIDLLEKTDYIDLNYTLNVIKNNNYIKIGTTYNFGKYKKGKSKLILKKNNSQLIYNCILSLKKFANYMRNYKELDLGDIRLEYDDNDNNDDDDNNGNNCSDDDNDRYVFIYHRLFEL